ncbi:MAG: DUF3108 domain-containing protein [FCB group bacterium]|nr:DUF3108 domain-containing protein [FCB group bacterium]
MRRLLVLNLILLFAVQLPGQVRYRLSVFGIPCGNVTLTMPQPNQLHFTTRSTGIVNLLWPFDNQYTTTFDTTTFGVRKYEKKIIQGSFKQKFKGIWQPEKGGILYGDTLVIRPENSQTVFTLMVLIRKWPTDSIDTRWFPLDHEGRFFRARFLLADTVRIPVGNKNVLCDHYRLDLVPQEETGKILDRSDYFNQNITRPEAIRQLWVERSGERRIIKASVKLFGISLEAKIEDE